MRKPDPDDLVITNPLKSGFFSGGCSRPRDEMAENYTAACQQVQCTEAPVVRAAFQYGSLVLVYVEASVVERILRCTQHIIKVPLTFHCSVLTVLNNINDSKMVILLRIHLQLFTR